MYNNNNNNNNDNNNNNNNNNHHHNDSIIINHITSANTEFSNTINDVVDNSNSINTNG